MSRESRLLLVTIAVSGTVLVLLAQFRFPDVSPSLPSAAPLERLAARASFEELATRVAQLETAIAPNLIVLRLAGRSDSQPTRFRDLLDGVNGVGAEPARHVAALRVDATTAVAAVPPDAAITGIVGAGGFPGTARVAARDPLRGIARVRVPEGPARTLPQRALDALRMPAYVVAVEGTQAGLTLRPVFLGRSDRFQSPRWSQPLLPLGGVVVTPGALLFTLDGEFLGAVVAEQGTLAVAGASETLDIVRALGTSMPSPVDPGVGLRLLTPEVAAAAGAERGVMVMEVIDDAPAADALEPGDVVVEVDGQPAVTPEQVLFRLSTRLAAGPVTVSFVRRGTLGTAMLEARPAAAAARVAEPLALQTVRGAGTRVRTVPPGSPLAQAGLMDGDLIVRAGDLVEPTAAEVEELLTLPEAGAVALVVRRGDRRQLFVVQRSASDDGQR